MLKRIPRRNHITPGLREVHWLKIHNLIIFKILLLTHKAVNNTAPEYVCDLIKFHVISSANQDVFAYARSNKSTF